MNKEEYAMDIIGICQALEDKPEYRKEIMKDFNTSNFEESVRSASRDKLRETANLGKVYLAEYVKTEQIKNDTRERLLARQCDRLESKKINLSYKLENLGFTGEFTLYYNGEPATENLFNQRLTPLYQERIELLKKGQTLRRAAQRYIRKNIPCMAGDSAFESKIQGLEDKLEKL